MVGGVSVLCRTSRTYWFARDDSVGSLAAAMVDDGMAGPCQVLRLLIGAAIQRFHDIMVVGVSLLALFMCTGAEMTR